MLLSLFQYIRMKWSFREWVNRGSEREKVVFLKNSHKRGTNSNGLHWFYSLGVLYNQFLSQADFETLKKYAEVKPLVLVWFVFLFFLSSQFLAVY